MMPAFVTRNHLIVPGYLKSNYSCLAGLFIMILFSACNSKDSKQSNSTTDSVGTYHLPDPIPLSKAETERIRNACEIWYDSALKPKGFNGGILVAKNGNIIFEKYSGTGHLPGTDFINENMPLQIASTSKTFTAMAILKLWQEGKLNLDDEFSKYFPQFNYPGVTIRTLLNHRSGLPNYTYFMENMGWDRSRIVHNEDVLAYLITCKTSFENVATPGVHFSYCNTNYALLALLIEKISGKKYAAFMQQQFFIPLQMKSTFVFSETDSNKVVPSYDWKGRLMQFSFLDAVYGDKNIYTTVRDLLKWDRALSSGLIFTPATLEEAYAPYSNEKPGIRNYGLGWRMNIYPDGKKIIYHNGWWHGSNSSFIRLLKDSVAIIVIGNKFTRAVYHSKVLTNIFGDYYNPGEEDESETLKFPDSLVVPNEAQFLQIPGTASKDSMLQKKLMDKNAIPVKANKRKKARY